MGDEKVEASVSCQVLLGGETQCHGWLRMKSKLQKCGERLGNSFKRVTALSNKLTGLIPWDNFFVVLSEGCVYVFKDETSTKQKKTLRLSGFKSIEKVTLEDRKDIPWPFKITTKTEKEYYLGATTTGELDKWIKMIASEMETWADDDDGEEREESDDDEYSVIDDENGPKKNKAHTESVRKDARRNVPLPALPPVPGSHQQKSATLNSREKPRMETVCAEDSGDDSGPEYVVVDDEVIESKPPRALPRVTPSKPPIGKQPAPAPQLQAFRTNSNPVQPKQLKPVPQKPPIPVSQKPKPVGIIHPETTKSKPPIPKPPEIEAQDDILYEPTDDYGTKTGKTRVELSMWNGEVEKGTQIMRSIATEGCYMLRKSVDGTGYTMSVYIENVPRKFKISNQGGKFSMAGQVFESLDQLVDHFHDNKLPNRDTTLTKPYSEFEFCLT